MIAILRQHHSLHKGSADSLYDKSWMDQLSIHILGACGELATAKALDKHWPGGVNQYKNVPDLPPDIEVRHRTRSDYDLIVRKDDPNERIYVLTLGDVKSLPTIQVVGWIDGASAKQDRWLRSYGGWKESYFVPQSELSDVALLRAASGGNNAQSS